MLLTSALLAVLAVLLAWPVPIVLASAQWPAAAPGVVLLLWQAIALAGGLSMIGALLTAGLAAFGDTLPSALARFGHNLFSGSLPADATFPEMFALAGAILLAVHLVLNLALTVVRTERQRRRHLQLVRLLSAPMPDRPGMRLIDHAAPVAYCLPGSARSITVLSAGLVALLDDDQLRAVIAHERAHVSQRHHLVLIAFRAWSSALPWFPITTRARDAVGVLVEMLADDRARKQVPDDVLAATVVRVALEGADPDAAGASAGAGIGASAGGWASGLDAAPMPRGAGSGVGSPAVFGLPGSDLAFVQRRLNRLSRPRLPVSARAGIAAIAVALVLVPTAMLVLPASGV
ncbi:MAG TPA: M56 family metallopeptidase [Humibacter sp.]|nr:M56 family metallopeptidase [Humibacter sp.]